MTIEEEICGLMEHSVGDFDTIKRFGPLSTEKIRDEPKSEDAHSKDILEVENLKRLTETLDVGTRRNIVAIDSSSVELGQTDTGIIAAVKACAIFNDEVKIYGPYVIPIQNDTKDALYKYFLKTIFNLTTNRQAPPLSRMLDRLRNFIERMVQRDVANTVKNSILLWDGSLGLRKATYDTPPELLSNILKDAQANGNSVVAVAKKSNLILGTSKRSIFTILAERPGPSAVCLTDKISIPDTTKLEIMGDTFAVRFKTGGFPFRVDTNPKGEGIEFLRDIKASTIFHHGYPVNLRNAHIHAKLIQNEVLGCQRMIATKYNLPIMNAVDMHKILLAPYG